MNEKASLGRLLARLRLAPGVHEVAVSDGGSSDRTASIVRSPHRLVRSEPGRGQQLRTGAEAATGDALLFLHADVLPPMDVAAQISEALGSGYVGGNFRLRYPDGGRSSTGWSGSRPSTADWRGTTGTPGSSSSATPTTRAAGSLMSRSWRT